MEVRECGQSIHSVFLKYLLSAGVAFILSVAISFLFFDLLINRGAIVPSNGTENEIFKNRKEIAAVDPFDANLIPERAKYVFLSDDGRVVETDMTKDEIERAMQFHDGKIPSTSSAPYMEVKRDDGYVVVSYAIKSYYRDAWMNRHLPESENLLLSIILLLCVLSGSGVTIIWAKKLTRQLNLMVKASEQIAEEDLDFEVEYSNVKEFNRVLRSLDEMKSALSESLRAQWEEGERRKGRVSALLHDVKTPLAIVKGNADLLKETDLSEEQALYVGYIAKNTDRMAEYMKALMLANKMESDGTWHVEEMSVRALGDRLASLVKEITSTSGRPLREEVALGDETIRVDVALLERAVQNIATNAVEYSPARSEIALRMRTGEHDLTIEVLDCGKGFTGRDASHGAEPFYRGDASRHDSAHYGLGLYSADQIARRHGGRLVLKNREDAEGAAVSIDLPLVEALGRR
ncbi:MAG: HAMP domain-containing sensor histidine kinase [Peptoniphilus sp.]|nr:HAMP domain-containing sensor histidine kinase [Peptoniphilus sp.]MDD7362673.1 HAMP domain-containing sensor histidine kinase [Bacillota bacterium]MDY6044928.1 HAMP domain-containing sensor histidine kinase [Peptoniphilus sp.]